MSTGIIGVYYCVQLYVGPRDSNSGLLKCTASTMSIELSPKRASLTNMGLVRPDADLCVRILSGICCVRCYCLSVCRRRLFQPYHSYKKQLQKVLESVCKVLYSGLHGK